MTTAALDGALAALDDAVRSTRALLRGAVADLQDVDLAPAAVSTILALCRTLSQGIAKLARAAAGQAAPPPRPEVETIDLATAQRVLDLLSGRAERCPACSGIMPPQAAQDALKA